MRNLKFMPVLLTGVLLATTVLSGCGKTQPVVANVDYSNNYLESWFPYNQELKDSDMEESISLGATTLNPSEVYNKMTYNELLFYGTHSNCKKTEDGYDTYNPSDEYISSMEWVNPGELLGIEHPQNNNAELKVSAIPYSFAAGAYSNINFHLSKLKDHYWCKLSYRLMDENGQTNDYFYVDAAYEVKGNELIIKPVTDIVGSEDSDIVTYSFTGKEIHYNFSFEGVNLTLSKDNVKTTLRESQFYAASPGKNTYTGSGETAANNHPIPDIDSLYLSYNESKQEVSAHFNYAPDNEGESYSRFTEGTFKYNDNGIIQFAFTDKSGNEHFYEYVYFPLGVGGVAFSDGDNTYIYLDSYYAFIENKYEGTKGINVVSKDQEKLASLQEEEIKILEETKDKLLTDFASSLIELGVQAVVKAETGEILFDSSILFEKNQAEISDEGKEALINFSKVFSETLGRDEYKNFLSQVTIQGHTDSDGDYDYNQTLSEQRAEAVKGCILDALSEDAEATALCEKLFLTEGCASDSPILDANGLEDKDASRRVVFVFFIDPDYLNK